MKGDKNKMGTKRAKISNRLREKVIYAVIGLAAFLCGVGLLLIFIFMADELGSTGIINKVYYILLFPFALTVAVFLFKLLSSTASFRGKVLGGTLKLGGPIVLFCLVVVGGFYLVPNDSPFDFTIFLQNEDGKTVLKERGKLKLRLDSDTRLAYIDKDGSATYKRIPKEFKHRAVSVEIEADGWWFSNHKVSIPFVLKGNSMPLIIERDDSLAVISGFIMDSAGNFLEGAKIVVKGLETETDEKGWFSLKIPTAKQQKKQTLYVRKNGFDNWSGFVYPGENPELEIRLDEEK
jgi:hypothetical protein